MKNSFFLFFLFLFGTLAAQFDRKYDQDLLPATFHKERREKLRALLPENSVAVFFANPVRNRANDVDYPYHQDPNFYYLTGLNEPHALLLIFKEEQKLDSISTHELIFVQTRNAMMEAWTGRRLGVEGVKKELGFEFVLPNKDFIEAKINFKKLDKVLRMKNYKDVRNEELLAGDLHDLIFSFEERIKSNINVDEKELYLLMASMREVKQEEELRLLKKAIDITCNAHLDLMKKLKPGMTEFQAEAIIEYNFRNQGAEFSGFPSIVGGGENSCILHYITNRKKLEGTNLLISDVGAEYHGYTADVTRTLPVDGKFSEEERLIYNIVLEAQEAGINVCRKDTAFSATSEEAVRVISKGLKDLGIIKKESEYFKYFFHGTSHHLGLDVHDPRVSSDLQPGHVITVEPGIYIAEGADCDPKWWNIGVRIEDDILITEGEPIILSGNLPKKTEEIEKIMASDSAY